MSNIIKLEKQLADSRKGFKNKLTSFFKNPSLRNESDGKSQNFKMNQSEKDMRGLVDLSFII
jgi:hypothetical protein